MLPNKEQHFIMKLKLVMERNWIKSHYQHQEKKEVYRHYKQTNEVEVKYISPNPLTSSCLVGLPMGQVQSRQVIVMLSARNHFSPFVWHFVDFFDFSYNSSF